MVIDAVTKKLSGVPFDRNGKIAAQGRVLETIVNQALRGSFFQQKPPRTAGREQFGYQFAKQFMHWCKKNRKANVKKGDNGTPATALTPASIQHSLHHYVMPYRPFQEFIFHCGGTKTPPLI